MRANGAIEGAAAGFSVGDEVLVLKKRDNTIIKVIGHTDGIRSCCSMLADFKQLSILNESITDYAEGKIPINHCDSGITIQATSGLTWKQFPYAMPSNIPILDPAIPASEWYWKLTQSTNGIGGDYFTATYVRFIAPAGHKSIGQTYRLHFELQVTGPESWVENDCVVWSGTYTHDWVPIHIITNVSPLGTYDVDIDVTFLGYILIAISTYYLLFNLKVFSILPATA